MGRADCGCLEAMASNTSLEDGAIPDEVRD